MLHGLGGPVRWPVFCEETGTLETVYVFDRNGPPDFIRKLTDKEVWTLQGRSGVPRGEVDGDYGKWIVEGAKATGAHTPRRAC